MSFFYWFLIGLGFLGGSAFEERIAFAAGAAFEGHTLIARGDRVIGARTIRADPAWRRDCAALGRFPFGRVVSVESEHFTLPAGQANPGVHIIRRVRRRGTWSHYDELHGAAFVGMELCAGDWIHTWFDSSLRIERRDRDKGSWPDLVTGALVIEPGSVIELERFGVVHRMGAADYYLLDDDDRFRVRLGEFGVELKNGAGFFRVRMTRAGSAEAWIGVSRQPDEFLESMKAHASIHASSMGPKGKPLWSADFAGGELWRVTPERAQPDAEKAEVFQDELSRAWKGVSAGLASAWARGIPGGAVLRRVPGGAYHLVVESKKKPTSVLIDGESRFYHEDDRGGISGWKRYKDISMRRGWRALDLLFLAPGMHVAEVFFDDGRVFYSSITAPSHSVSPELWSVRAEGQPLEPPREGMMEAVTSADDLARPPSSGARENASARGGLEWVSIPGGTFMMGTDLGASAQRPAHRVRVPSFRMTKTEVTVEAYQACVAAGACEPPRRISPYCTWGRAGFERHPINCVSWTQARDYCAWIGGRLPSEAEWEYAARGDTGREYVWGNEPPERIGRKVGNFADDTARQVNTSWMVVPGYSDGYAETAPVGRFPAGRSPFGVLDMAGNVAEWVEDCLHLNYVGAPTDGSAWTWECSGDVRVRRGGGFNEFGLYLWATHRDELPRNQPHFNTGIRCVR